VPYIPPDSVRYHHHEDVTVKEPESNQAAATASGHAPPTRTLSLPPFRKISAPPQLSSVSKVFRPTLFHRRSAPPTPCQSESDVLKTSVTPDEHGSSVGLEKTLTYVSELSHEEGRSLLSPPPKIVTFDDGDPPRAHSLDLPIRRATTESTTIPTPPRSANAAAGRSSTGGGLTKAVTAPALTEALVYERGRKRQRQLQREGSNNETSTSLASVSSSVPARAPAAIAIAAERHSPSTRPSTPTMSSKKTFKLPPPATTALTAISSSVGRAALTSTGSGSRLGTAVTAEDGSGGSGDAGTSGPSAGQGSDTEVEEDAIE
jgi:hypothetical protein